MVRLDPDVHQEDGRDEDGKDPAADRKEPERREGEGKGDPGIRPRAESVGKAPDGRGGERAGGPEEPEVEGVGHALSEARRLEETDLVRTPGPFEESPPFRLRGSGKSGAGEGKKKRDGS